MSILQEKMYEWTEDKIRWYQDAMAYPKNNRNECLVELILKELGKSPSICDLGCGVGSLSISLSRKAQRVIAIDSNRDALNALRNQIEQEGIDNIEVKEGDIKVLLPEGEMPDAAVLCMAGRLEEQLPYALKWAKKKVFFITGNDDYHSFKVGQKKKTQTPPKALRNYIEKQGLHYSEQIIEAQYGQPFRNEEDAIKFMKCYDREETLESIKEHLAHKLVSVQDKAFPLYYPCEKSYRVFSIDC